MYSNEDLINGFKSNNEALIKAFYVTEWPKIRNLVVQNGGNEIQAKDLMQDGIMSLFLNISQDRYISTSEAKLSTYFVQICKNKLKDLYKSAHFRKTSSITEYEEKKLEETMDFEQAAEEDPRIEITMNSVTQLGQNCQDILKRYYWQKQNLSEISVHLNMTEESIKNAKYRCMKKLRELVQSKI